MAAGDAPSSEYPETPPAHWPARLPPPPATPPPPSRGGAAIIIAAAVAFTLLVTYGLGQALVRADDPGGRVAPATLDTTTTSVPVEGEVPLEQAAPALIAFVERERHARFAPVPQIVGQTDTTFETAAATVADRNAALFRHEITYQALGATSADLRAELRVLAARASVAVYDASSSAVLVRGDMTTPYVRSQIVAVLTRVLDRQLPRLPDPPFTAYDATFAAEAVAAGSAATISAAYVSQLDQADQASFARDEREVEELRGASGAAQVTQFIDVLPTLAGRQLVFDLLRPPGGPGAVDQAFADPPASSEQAFDPAAFASADPPLSLDQLTAPEGRVLDSGRFGYADVLVTLFHGVIEPNDGSSPEWGGGRFQTWRSGAGELCVQARVAGDSQTQTSELFARFEDWADEAGPAATAALVDDVSLGRAVVELRRCA